MSVSAQAMARKLGAQKDVLALARACRYEKGHAAQVAILSLELFDQLYRLHKLGENERTRLLSAAILHDIGWIKGQRRHHKTSRDIIVSSPLLKLQQKEKIIIALIARYHRRALPKNSHKYYSKLMAKDRDIVEKLSAILRLADGLDWRHSNLVKKLKCDIAGPKIIISLDAVNFVKKDMRKAREKIELCEKVFHGVGKYKTFLTTETSQGKVLKFWLCQSEGKPLPSGLWLCQSEGKPLPSGLWLCQSEGKPLPSGLWLCQSEGKPLPSGLWLCQNEVS